MEYYVWKYHIGDKIAKSNTRSTLWWRISTAGSFLGGAKWSFVDVIGPKGSGKSTLLKNIYRIYKLDSGEIAIDNKNLLSMKEKDCAKQIAILDQESNTQFDFTVEQVVKMGRYPYKSVFQDYSKDINCKSTSSKYGFFNTRWTRKSFRY